MTYEYMRKWFTKEGEKNPTASRKLLAGAIAGGVAQTFTYPLYVIALSNSFLPRFSRLSGRV